MALDKIRQANKKAKRENKRRLVRQQISRSRQQKKVQRARTRSMFIQGREEYNQKRREDKSYIDALEAELAGE